MGTEGEHYHEQIVPAPRGRVWEALTKTEQIGQWFAPVIQLVAESGGAFYCAWPESDTEVIGRVAAIEPGRRLIVETDDRTRVTIEIADVQTAEAESGTRVILLCDRFGGDECELASVTSRLLGYLTEDRS